MANEYARLLIDLEANTRKFTGPMNQAAGKINKMHAGMKSFAQTMMSSALGYQMMRFAKASVQAFGEFNQAMTESAAIMTGATGQMRSEMKKTAIELSTNSAKSAAELAKSYFYLASAGMNVKQSIAALPTVEQFATAGMFDMSQATELLTDALSALGLSSQNAETNMKNMTRLSDVLVKANTLANASVEQFSMALTNKAAASLRLLNKDVEEGVAILAAFADQGLKDAEAGRALYIVLRDLQKAATTNAGTWERLNLSVYDSEGRMLRVSEIIRQLNMKFSSMSDENKKMTASMLGFQDRSFSYIQTLLGMSDKVDEYEEKLRSAGGTTKDIADKQMTAFNMQMKRAKNEIIASGIAIGETLEPAVTLLTKGFVALTEAMEHSITRFQRIGQYAARNDMGVITTTLMTLASLHPVGYPIVERMISKDDSKTIADVEKQVTGLLDYIEDGEAPVNDLGNALEFLGGSMSGAGDAASESLSPFEKFIQKVKADAVPAIDKLRESYNMLIDASESGIITDTEKISGMSNAWKEYASTVEGIVGDGTLIELQLQMERLQKQFDTGQIDKAPFENQMQQLKELYEMQSADMSGRAGFVDYIKAMFAGMSEQQKVMDEFQQTFGGFAEQIMQETQSPFEKYMEHIWKLDQVLQAGMITWEAYWKSAMGAYADFADSAGMNFMNQMMGGGQYALAPQVPSSGMQMMDISNQRFQAPGVAATMSASEAMNMSGGTLEDINRQQLTTQKSIDTGINQLNYLLGRGLL